MNTIDQKMMAVFDLALGFLYPSQLGDALFMVQKAKLMERGRQDGRAAGTWFFNGPVDTEVSERILKGIKDGDPEIMDLMPTPRLSGEWADEPTWSDIVKDELGIDVDSLTIDDHEWLDAYETGFSEACQFEIERTCLVHLGHGSMRA